MFYFPTGKKQNMCDVIVGNLEMPQDACQLKCIVFWERLLLAPSPTPSLYLLPFLHLLLLKIFSKFCKIFHELLCNRLLKRRQMKKYPKLSMIQLTNMCLSL